MNDHLPALTPNYLAEIFEKSIEEARRHPRLIRMLGLPERATSMCGAIGITQIMPHDRFFELDPEGKHAVLLPVQDGRVSNWEDPLPDAPIRDLAAFFPEAPKRHFVLRGSLWALNAFIAEDLVLRPSITIHETPHDWLKANREGLCVLDWRQGIPILANLGRHLEVSDQRFGRFVRKRIRAYNEERSSIVRVRCMAAQPQ